MKNKSNTVRTITEVGMFAALGFVFDELQGILSKGIFVNGGSIGFAMIAVLIVAYRRGFIPAFLTGLLMGLLDIATSAYILNPMQLVLDYILPYAVVGLAGLFKPFFDRAQSKNGKILWILIGAVVGGVAKFFSHYFAGIFFWADPANFAWDLNSMNPYLYCFVYNIAFIGPSIFITAALLMIVYAAAPRVLTNKSLSGDDRSEKQSIEKPLISGVVMAAGLFVFVYYLIKYIKSFWVEQYDGAIDYSFDSDCMVIMTLGILIAVTGIICLIGFFKKKFSYAVLTGGLTVASIASLVYSMARWLRMIVKAKVWNTYLIWYLIALLSLAVFASLFAGIVGDKNKDNAIEE